MKLKDRIIRRIDEIDRKNKIPVKMWHSRSYHNHFKGYSEYSVPKKNKRGYTRVRVYTGKYYRQCLEKKQKILLRILYAVLFIVSAAIYFICTTAQHVINMTWYVTIFEAIQLGLLFWTGTSLVSYLTHFGDFKEPQYRTAMQWIKNSSMFAALCSFVIAIDVAVMVLFLKAADMNALVFSGLFCVSGLCLLVINRVECRIQYEIVENETPEPYGSIKL